MKKALSIVLALTLCLGLCACGVPAGTASTPSASNRPTQPATQPTQPTTQPTRPTTLPTQPTQTDDDSVHYISDRRVYYMEYNDAPAEHIVFFGLKNSSKEYVSSSGTAEITIRDNSGTIIYYICTRFIESDFSSWAIDGSTPRTLCALHIDRDDLKAASSSSGTLTLKVTLDDGTYFDAKQMNISDLPVAVDDDVHYISDRSVQYNEAPDEYIVFFGLQNSNKEYIASSGVAVITIRDDGGEIIYDKSIPFDKNDFTSWTNSYWDSSRYLCGLYIARSELEGAASSSGTLTLKVTLSDGTWFEAKELYISNLPPVTVNIILPEIPAVYQDSRYSSYTSTVQVSKLECETTISYDGTARVTIEVILKLLSKTGKTNESSTVCVGYKLYDSDGIVVDSGHIYSNPIAVGEASREDFTIYDLDPRETYTLIFINAS